jgi:putative ABC transport system ATP-binding protein
VEPLVQTVGLAQRYRVADNAVEAVVDVSLTIGAGEFVAVLGRSGSGKSTLLSLLGLLETPDAGEYWLNGRRVSGIDADSRAAIRNREIGFVFQWPALLPRASAVENVALPLAYAGVGRADRLRRAERVLARLGLGDRQQHRPNQLSGGEQQRVVIARAIASNPALILADEPTGALDNRTADEILEIFDELHRDGRTIIVATHAAEVAAHADRRLTVDDGRILARNGPAPHPATNTLPLPAEARR